MRQTHNPFPGRLKAMRKARGLTQEQLAEAVGLTHGTISRFEKGKIAPAYETLLALAEALGCEPGDLTDGPVPVATSDLARAHDMLGRIDPEDLPQAVRALRGFVREDRRDFVVEPAKPAKKKPKRS